MAADHGCAEGLVRRDWVVCHGASLELTVRAWAATVVACGVCVRTLGGPLWWKHTLSGGASIRYAARKAVCGCVLVASPSCVCALAQLFFDGDGSGERLWADLSALLPPRHAAATQPLQHRTIVQLVPVDDPTPVSSRKKRYVTLARAEQLLCLCRRPERPGEMVVRAATLQRTATSCMPLTPCAGGV